MTRGACLCGAVRFEIAPPYPWFAYCHCSMCRRHHGALFNASLGVERERFRWLAGENKVRAYNATPAFERAFCLRCGSKTPAASHLPDVLHVPAGSLDPNLGAAPRAHIFAASRSPLAPLRPGMRRFDAYPPGVGLRVRSVPRAARGTVTGQCLCGDNAYALRANRVRIEHCSCVFCRRSRGAPFATTAVVAAGDLVWIRSEAEVMSFRSPPPRAYRTDYCARCGSVLPTASAHVGVAFVPAGSLDGLDGLDGQAGSPGPMG